MLTWYGYSLCLWLEVETGPVLGTTLLLRFSALPENKLNLFEFCRFIPEETTELLRWIWPACSLFWRTKFFERAVDTTGLRLGL